MATKKKNKNKNTKVTKVGKTTITTTTKSIRRVFDKKLLCFKVRKGKEWDTSITARMIKEETPERDILFRTVKLVLKEETETFADVLRFRVDWLVPDGKGKFGTVESIEQTLKVCEYNLDLIDDELVQLGFKKVGLVRQLNLEDRRSKDQKTLSDKLVGLGLELSDDAQFSQLALSTPEDSLHLFSSYEDSSESK